MEESDTKNPPWLGLSLIRTESLPDMHGSEVRNVPQTVRPYTMTSAERVAALVEAVRYLASANVEVLIVECGVWRGGSLRLSLEPLGNR